ncbi:MULTISPECIES: hypothetical protein [Myxococcus]|uniref:hypothetical protein n=1 Tax=Myxococcus TaxID=32 RepID=UPI0013D77FA1|nr:MULTISPECIES: hypothetical protein [Myxococcus]NVJ27046.1 hypothetical protein [Myxococcus sp. AM011]
MDKRGMKWAGVAVAIIIGTTAWAGNKRAAPVTVTNASDGTGHAQGSLAGARNSADATQHIGCHLISYAASTGGPVRVLCVANSAAGVYGTCSSTDPVIVEGVRSIGDESYLWFNWDASGQCTYLHVSKISYYEPKLF